jgi:hypothetical protein
LTPAKQDEAETSDSGLHARARRKSRAHAWARIFVGMRDRLSRIPDELFGNLSRDCAVLIASRVFLLGARVCSHAHAAHALLGDGSCERS